MFFVFMCQYFNIEHYILTLNIRKTPLRGCYKYPEGTCMSVSNAPLKRHSVIFICFHIWPWVVDNCFKHYENDNECEVEWDYIPL